MSRRGRLMICLGLGALVAAGAAQAAEAPMATADETPPIADPQTVDQQIDAYLASSPAIQAPVDAGSGVVESGPRKVHGEAGVAIGTGGYRSAYAITHLPVGETGTLSIAVQDTHGPTLRRGGRFGGRGYDGGDRQSLGVSLALGGAANAESTACDRDPNPGPRSRRATEAPPADCADWGPPRGGGWR